MNEDRDILYIIMSECCLEGMINKKNYLFNICSVYIITIQLHSGKPLARRDSTYNDVCCIDIFFFLSISLMKGWQSAKPL